MILEPDIAVASPGSKNWFIPIYNSIPISDGREATSTDISFCNVVKEGSKEWSHHRCDHHDLSIFWR